MLYRRGVQVAWTSFHAPGPTWVVLVLSRRHGDGGGLPSSRFVHAFLVITLRVSCRSWSASRGRSSAGGAGLPRRTSPAPGRSRPGPVPYQAALARPGRARRPADRGPHALRTAERADLRRWAAAAIAGRVTCSGPAAASTSSRGRVAGHRRRHGHRRDPVPLRPHPPRRCARRRRALLQLRPSCRRGSMASPAVAAGSPSRFVIFGFWRPDLTLVGAYLFGASRASPRPCRARRRRPRAAPRLAPVPRDHRGARGRVVRVGSRRLGAPAALGTPYEDR